MAQPLEVLSVLISISFLLILLIVVYMIFTSLHTRSHSLVGGTESPMQTNLELHI